MIAVFFVYVVVALNMGENCEIPIKNTVTKYPVGVLFSSFSGYALHVLAYTGCVFIILCILGE